MWGRVGRSQGPPTADSALFLIRAMTQLIRRSGDLTGHNNGSYFSKIASAGTIARFKPNSLS